MFWNNYFRTMGKAFWLLFFFPWGVCASSLQEIFFRACDCGDVEQVRKVMLQEEVDLNLPHDCGRTGLYKATERGYVDIVKLLLGTKKLKLSSQICGLGSSSPLHAACANGNLDMVKILFSHPDGATLDYTNQDGYRPLQMAASFGYVELVPFLIGVKRCVDIDYGNDEVKSAYEVACLLYFDKDKKEKRKAIRHCIDEEKRKRGLLVSGYVCNNIQFWLPVVLLRMIWRYL